MKKQALIISFSLLIVASLAQSDSAKIEFSQEQISKQSILDQTICEILTKREKRQKDIWKFNILGNILTEYNLDWGYWSKESGINVSYEHRINNKWTYNLSSTTDAKNAINRNVNQKTWNAIVTEYHSMSNKKEFGQKISSEIRYYHNSKRRARLGKRADFSGNYFAIAFDNSFSSSSFLGTFLYMRDTLYQNEYLKSKSLTQSVKLMYGIQRRIGKIGFIDFEAGYGRAWGYSTSNDSYRVYSYSSLLRTTENNYKFKEKLRQQFTAKISFGFAF